MIKNKSCILRFSKKDKHKLTKDSGYVIINVKNYKKFAIGDDVCSVAASVGLKLLKTYQMRLTNLDYKLKTGNAWHTEPIYVFKKN